MRFNPPTEGLLPDENVVWARKQGIGFWIPFFSIFIGVGGFLLIIFSFAFAGQVAGLIAIIPVLIAIFFLTRAFISAVKTKFFLTNKRIIQAKGTTIVKEVPLERFGDKPLKQYIEMKVGYLENNEPRYVIKINDPVTAETIIDCRGLDKTSVEAFEKIGKETRCQYCNQKNPALNARCSYCGAPL
jgi:hypothetical protein